MPVTARVIQRDLAYFNKVLAKINGLMKVDLMEVLPDEDYQHLVARVEDTIDQLSSALKQLPLGHLYKGEFYIKEKCFAPEKKVFKVSGAGKVAGSKVTEGEINSASDVRIIRDGNIIYTGKVSTIFREKNQVKQVSDGQECGITVKDYMDFQKNDTIEAFSVTSTERSI